MTRRAIKVEVRYANNRLQAGEVQDKAEALAQMADAVAGAPDKVPKAALKGAGGLAVGGKAKDEECVVM